MHVLNERFSVDFEHDLVGGGLCRFPPAIEVVWQLVLVFVAEVCASISLLINIPKLIIKIKLFTIYHLNQLKRIIIALLEVLGPVTIQ